MFQTKSKPGVAYEKRKGLSIDWGKGVFKPAYYDYY